MTLREVLGFLAEARSDAFDQHVDGILAHVLGGGVGAEQVFKAAAGHFVGDGAQFEIGHAGQFGHLRGGDGARRGIGAEDGLDAHQRHQAAGLALGGGQPALYQQRQHVDGAAAEVVVGQLGSGHVLGITAAGEQCRGGPHF